MQRMRSDRQDQGASCGPAILEVLNGIVHLVAKEATAIKGYVHKTCLNISQKFNGAHPRLQPAEGPIGTNVSAQWASRV